MAEANIHFRKFDLAYATMMVTVHVTEEWKIRQTIVPPAPKLPPPTPPQPIAEDPFRPVALQGSAVVEVQHIPPRKAAFDL